MYRTALEINVAFTAVRIKYFEGPRTIKWNSKQVWRIRKFSADTCHNKQTNERFLNVTPVDIGQFQLQEWLYSITLLI